MNSETMIFWHGGDLSDIDNTFKQQTKKQEYGPGLYLTTSYEVVKKYIKGSRKLYRVEVSIGNSLEDAKIDYDTVLEFLYKLPRSISIKLKNIFDKHNKNGFVRAEIINNVFVNNNLLKPEISYKLKQFYLENDIDYSLVTNAFGWGEDMMVLFNTNKITNVQRIGPKDKIDKFELHKEGVESNQKCSDIKLTDEMKNEMSKFNSDEEFLRKGGFSIEALDRAAFGFSSEDVKTLRPNQLNIKWKDDYENVIYEQNKSGLSKIDWANKINLNEPIDVIFEKNKFFIDDGHHRFYAAKILNKPLNVNLIIKQNPIIYLNKDLSYDDFHRCAFSIFKKQTQLEEMEISKKELENQKVINQAHTYITRNMGKGSDYAPNVHELQKWIDDNPEKVKQITKGELKEDAEDVNFMGEITKGELEEAKKKKGDRCTRIAKRKYDVWPSAYSSAAVVRCRQGKIWKDLKEEEQSLDEKTDFSKEKEQGLHGWFARQGGKGKSKGWVDCNTCRDGKCKSCGRKEDESRSKYPACRPTPSACKTKGKGKSWGKKSTNEDVLNEENSAGLEIEFTRRGGNEIVDEKGNPLLLYHGTSRGLKATDLKQSRLAGDYGEGIYFTTDKREAEQVNSENIIEANVKSDKHLVIGSKEYFDGIYKNLEKKYGYIIPQFAIGQEAKKAGYTSIEVERPEGKWIIVFDGAKIRTHKKQDNEDVLNEQSKQEIERELKLNEIKTLFQRHIGEL